MKTVMTLEQLISDYQKKPQDLLNHLAHHEIDEGFVFLHSNNNLRIREGAYLSLPKALLKELEILSASNRLCNCVYHIMHPLAIKKIGVENFFLQFHELEGEDKNIIPKFIFEQEVSYTPRRFIDEGYGQKQAVFLSNANKILSSKKIKEPENYTMSIISVKMDNIFVRFNSELVKILYNPSFEEELSVEVRVAMLKGGCNVQNYAALAEPYLRKKYPRIPKEALDRIIEMSKPDNYRKRRWWQE